MKTKTTKRRKVWVNIHDGGVNGDYATAWLSRKAAKTNSGVRVRAVAVPFAESRPGDVVLGRERSKRINEILDALHGSNMFIGPTVIELRALLRGDR